MHFYYRVHSQAIGHFVRDTEYAIFWHKRLSPDSKLTLLHSDFISNKYFHKVLKKQFIVRHFSIWYRLLYRLIRTFPEIRRHRILTPEFTRDFSAIMHSQSTLFKAESTAGRSYALSRLLEERTGMKIGDPYIVLIVRDSKHDQIFYPDQVNIQSYRHTPITSFFPALTFLSENGYRIVRMGRNTNSSIELSSINLFDYSNNKDLQSDEFDFYLFQHCQYVVSTGSGIEEIGSLFRKKICLVNVSPPNSEINAVTYPVALSADYFQHGVKLPSRLLYDFTKGRLNPRDIPIELGIEIRPKNANMITSFIEFFHSVHLLEYSEIRSKAKCFANLYGLELIDNILY